MPFANPPTSVLKILVDITSKVPAFVATTANITLSGLQTIDGFYTPIKVKILVKNQTNPIENGTYVAYPGAWVRSTDTLESGMIITIQSGTVNGGTQWYLSTAGVIIPGTTSLTFTKFIEIATVDGGLSLAGGILKGSLLQSILTEVTVDTTTTSTTFVTLLSQAITISAGSILIVQFVSSSSNGGALRFEYYRILIDGTPYRGASCKLTNIDATGGASISIRVPGLAAGSRTVIVQWRVSGGTGQIRPVTVPDGESASVLIQEVTV